MSSKNPVWHRERDGEAKALWDTLRQGRTRQTTEARDLHRQAAVPEGPCGLEELEKFQQALGTQYQFKGPPAPNVICLLKADTHYNGCTSFKGFLNRNEERGTPPT